MSEDEAVVLMNGNRIQIKRRIFEQFIDTATDGKNGLSTEMQAFQRLKELRKQTVPDTTVLDYDKELAEARDEKYCRFD